MLPEQPERSLDGGTKPGTSLCDLLRGVPAPKQKGFVLPKSDKPMPSINGRFVFKRTFGKRPPGFCNRATGEAAHHCNLWARGYCVSTVGIDEEMIRQYVRWQEKQEREDEEKQRRLF